MADYRAATASMRAARANFRPVPTPHPSDFERDICPACGSEVRVDKLDKHKNFHGSAWAWCYGQ